MDKSKSGFKVDKYRDRRRSRSPQSNRHKDTQSHKSKDDRKERRRSRSRSSLSSSSSEDNSHPKSSTSARSPKFSVNLKPPLKTGIKLKLAAPAKPAQTSLPKPSAFNNESDSEEEEMPAEARMRMKNIGKNTPTSAGPNSFGKTKEGFVDSKKMFEKKMQQMLDLE